MLNGAALLYYPWCLNKLTGSSWLLSVFFGPVVHKACCCTTPHCRVLQSHLFLKPNVSVCLQQSELKCKRGGHDDDMDFSDLCLCAGESLPCLGINLDSDWLQRLQGRCLHLHDLFISGVQIQVWTCMCVIICLCVSDCTPPLAWRLQWKASNIGWPCVG